MNFSDAQIVLTSTSVQPDAIPTMLSPAFFTISPMVFASVYFSGFGSDGSGQE